MINQAEQLPETEYTSESYGRFMAELQRIREILVNPDRNQAMVNQGAADLDYIIGQLVKKADFTSLNAAIDQAKQIAGNSYTPDSYGAVLAALETAERIAADELSPQTAIDQAETDLRDAMEKLVPKADFTLLNSLIAQAKSKIETDYTQVSYQEMRKALEAAEKTAADASASQTAVDEAAAGLKKAMDSLKRRGSAVIQIKKKKYNKTFGSKAFSLGARANCKLKYKSSNTRAVSVNSKGKVTIKGCGKATITLTASAKDFKTAVKKVTITVKPKKAAISSLKSIKKKTAAVVWKRDKKATGYQVQYCLSKKFTGSKTKLKTITKNKTTELKLKKLKRRKTYYVRVRSYKQSGSSKIYGTWSKTKTVKVK